MQYIFCILSKVFLTWFPCFCACISTSNSPRGSHPVPVASSAQTTHQSSLYTPTPIKGAKHTAWWMLRQIYRSDKWSTMSVTRHESVWTSGVTHPFIRNLEMVDQLHAETPFPLEAEIPIFPEWGAPPTVDVETFLWFWKFSWTPARRWLSTEESDFRLYQLVYNSFCPVGSWIKAAETWRWQSSSVSCWYYPHLCLIFPLANFGQTLNLEFPHNPHVFLYDHHFQSTECDRSDTPGIWPNQL